MEVSAKKRKHFVNPCFEQEEIILELDIIQWKTEFYKI